MTTETRGTNQIFDKLFAGFLLSLILLTACSYFPAFAQESNAREIFPPKAKTAQEFQCSAEILDALGRVTPPKDYHSVAISDLECSPTDFPLTIRKPSEFIDFGTLIEPNPLDIDRYLGARIPAPIAAILASPGNRLILLPDLLPNAIATLRKHGLVTGVAFLADMKERVQVAFLLFPHSNGCNVVVTHLFGATRAEHLLWQYSFLFHRQGRDPETIEIWETRHPDVVSQELCFDALKNIQPDLPTVIFSGYFGSLKHVLADIEAFSRSHPGVTPSRSELDRIRASANPGQIEPRRGGNQYFPFWETQLRHPDGRLTRCIGFRNLYGDQTGILLKCLLEKGFRRFVLFSNAGGLSHTSLRGMYAPVVAREKDKVISMKNRAAQIYPGRSIISVTSLLTETVPWLVKYSLCSLVDVECYHAANALQARTDVNLFYGILVSDQPGKVDITRKEEDAPEVIEAKRGFFFSVIRKIFRNEF